MGDNGSRIKPSTINEVNNVWFRQSTRHDDIDRDSVIVFFNHTWKHGRFVMTILTHIGDDTLEVCLDALEIVIENDEETLKAFLGAGWDRDYLHEIIAAGITDEIGEYEISEVQTYLDRFNAYTSIKAVLNVV
jgi:hypothetical protein